MNLNKENTYNTTTLPHFWRDNKKLRTANTGMNPNIIKNDIPYTGKREYLNEYIDCRLYYTTAMRSKRKSSIETVNGCLSDIYSEGRGYVFTDAQLDEVKSIIPRIRCSWNTDICCYSCLR